MPSIDSMAIDGKAMNITLSDCEKGGVIVVAFYENDIVSNVTTYTPEETVTAEVNDGDKVKVIWLESMESLKSVCASESIEIQ